MFLEALMRKIWSILLVAAMLLTLCGLAAQAQDWEDEEEDEISLEQLDRQRQENATPTPAPDPFSTPAPTATPVPTPAPQLQADGSLMLTITAVGDVTIGRNVQHSGTSIFDKELAKQGGDINFIFRNVKDIFEADDLTIANFEGVLASNYTIPSSKKNNDYLFLGDPSYAQALSDNGVEAVTMENNHIGDFGEDGIRSTIAAMEAVGVVWANKDHLGVYETQGVKIGMLAYQIVPPLRSDEMKAAELQQKVARDIAAAKESCDLVFVSFHWGKELDYSPRDESPYCQITLGRAAIDAGADLVLGHHSHRINPIECYKGRYIVYSLANCSFAGNNKPSDMFTFIFQTRFRLKNGEIVGNSFRIIPCRISSRKDYNDFAITPLTDVSNINTVVDFMTKKENTKKLEYAVLKLPMEWEN